MLGHGVGCEAGIGICHFSESSPSAPLFIRDLHQYLFSLTERSPERIFTITKKGEKQKQRSEFVLSPTGLPLWEPHLSASSLPSSRVCLGTSVLYPDLSCASISMMCPKVSE